MYQMHYLTSWRRIWKIPNQSDDTPSLHSVTTIDVSKVCHCLLQALDCLVFPNSLTISPWASVWFGKEREPAWRRRGERTARRFNSWSSTHRRSARSVLIEVPSLFRWQCHQSCSGSRCCRCCYLAQTPRTSWTTDCPHHLSTAS